MKQILISDGACIKEVLLNNVNDSYKRYDRVFVGNKDVSDSDDLLSVFQNVNDRIELDSAKAVLTLSGIISKCLYLYGNEEDLHIDLCIKEQVILLIKKEIELKSIYLPPTVLIEEKIIDIEENRFEREFDVKRNMLSSESFEKPVTLPKQEKDAIQNEENLVREKLFNEAETPKINNVKDNYLRTEEILAITKGMSFEREGRSFSKKQMDMIIKLLKSRKKFSVSEIAEATGINYHTIYAKKNALCDENKIKKEKPRKVPVRKKDSTATAREEREKELLELASKFHPVLDETNKKLTNESAEELRKIFINKERNWKVAEICNATGLKKSVINKALDEDLTSVDNEDKKIDVFAESLNCQDNFDYKVTDKEIEEGNSLGVFPNGNILEDAEGAIEKKLSDRDKAILMIAFDHPEHKEFDADVASVLIKNDFTYTDMIAELKPVFQFFKAMRVR